MSDCNRTLQDGIVGFDAESTYGCMRKLSSDWIYENRLYSMPEALAQVEQVTSEEVMRVVGRFPLREKHVLTTLGPLSERELLS